ncbi:MAG: hypothetical protein IKO47_07470 [Ruminococcus sp.]|nr:hypothetical protein [Ruminococcus sp.]
MKKIAFITAIAVLSAFSAVSCSGDSGSSSETAATEPEIQVITSDVNLSDYPMGGVIPPEQYRTSMLEGNDNNIGYEQFIDDDMFKGMMMSFTMESNPLQLASGTDKNAHISQVFKIAVTDDEKMLGLSNIWNYLVSADDRALGVIKVDCRKGMPQAHNYYSAQGIARKLNEVQEGERLAVFSDGNELDIYGIFEDGRVINLMGSDRYTGSLTYSDIAAGDNVITVGKYGDKL